MSRILAALALAFLAGCGSKSPTAPPTVVTLAPAPAPEVGSTNDGITGARVSASVETQGGVATVTAPGYLTRQQPASPVVWLWPQSEAYVRMTVYTNAGDGAPIRLSRWAPGATVRVALAPGLERFQPNLQEAAAELARAARLPVLVLPAGDTSANVNVIVDPASVPSGFAAYTRTMTINNALQSVRVAFLSEREITGNAWRNLLLHELGHALGLGHSPDNGDVMSAAPNRRNESSFGDPELRALTMMYSWRKAGNALPDNEAAGLARAGRTTQGAACSRPSPPSL